MAVVVGLELLARRMRLPPAAAFILGGIALALIPGVPDITLDPDLALLLFLPPLLLSSAFFTVWRDFRANLRIILQLAVGAVAFTTLGVGLVAHSIEPSLPLAACFALGAIVSPPDAVAAKAVLQGLSLPPRITVPLEGESIVQRRLRPGAVSLCGCRDTDRDVRCGAGRASFRALTRCRWGDCRDRLAAGL